MSSADVRVEAPRSLAAALAALASGPARLLAGGTDLMVELAHGRAAVERIVDLSRVPELAVVRHGADGSWLGATATCAQLLDDVELGRRMPLLAAALREFAAPQIRQRATIGGNLGTASPAGDLAPALLVLDAVVRLRSVAGARDVPMPQFCTGYRRHAGRPDELVEAVFVPARPAGERTAFLKVGTRAAQAIAKVALAVGVVVADGRWVRVAAAAGAVADRALLLPSVGALAGHRPTAAAIAAAARGAALHDCAPIDDVRSTARYRRHVVARGLAALLGELAMES